MADFSAFSQFTRSERLDYLQNSGLLTREDIAFLNQSVNPHITDLAENFTENVIGCFPLPLGIVPRFPMDGREYAVPLAIEETSVIAGLNKTAKWIRTSGSLHAKVYGETIIGQIQFPDVKDFKRCQKKITQKANELLDLANQCAAPSLAARGGGATHLQIRKIGRGDGGYMAVVHVYMNPCNAMGANLINQICEFLRRPLEELLNQKANMCILSNLADSKLTEAVITLPIINRKNLTKKNTPYLNQLQAEKISEAALFARQDPYRAATNNKGVMNGIDGLLIATGNDWRAVEAGVHAYAARNGQYRSITDWQIEGKYLTGRIIAPIIVGTVGGVTKLHPTAQLNLRLLNISQSDELSRLCAAVGLAQNLAALRALTAEGIVKGHMKLHIRNLLMASGADKPEQEILALLAAQFLKEKNKITQSDIQNLLAQWRLRST